MEPTTPARALVSTGVAMLIMFGAGAAAVPGTSAVADPARPSGTSTTTQASETTSTVVLARRHHHRKHHRRHHVRHHRRHHTTVRTSSVHLATTGRYSGAVNTSSLDAVNSAYQTSFAPGLNVPMGFTGDESRCMAGTSSAQSRAATLRAINFVRSLAGLAPVSFSPTLNNRAQLTALMMSANRAVSHTPPRSWRCYTSTGAANAGRSNLLLSYPEITAAGVVQLYTTDPGSNNGAAGHRRWLLNPFATAMGSGSTRAANAITVIGPTSASRANPSYVSWPTAGYFPNTLEPGGRWSLSAGNRAVSFSQAAVSVSRNGTPIRTVRNRVENGYAQPTLVWQIPADQARSGTYRVVVRGIRLGSQQYTSSYTVRMFAPR